jgi:hypothetical protein
LTNRVTDETYFFFRREAVDRFLAFAAGFLAGFLAAFCFAGLAGFLAAFFASFAGFFTFRAGLRAGFFAGLAAAPASIASVSRADVPDTSLASPYDGSSTIIGAANETGAS